jgi:hypothetical protein
VYIFFHALVERLYERAILRSHLLDPAVDLEQEVFPWTEDWSPHITSTPQRRIKSIAICTVARGGEIGLVVLLRAEVCVDQEELSPEGLIRAPR